MDIDPGEVWRGLIEGLRERGLGRLLVRQDPSVDAKRSPVDPAAGALDPLLPSDYRRFVAEYGYPALGPPPGIALPEDLEDSVNDLRVEFAFMAPAWMLRGSGMMGVPGRSWCAVRDERERSEHRWRYALFAAWDFGECCGWAFGTPETGGEPLVWQVEDSLPEGPPLGPFARWLRQHVALTLRRLDAMVPRDRRRLAEALHQQL
jgi:hypothetical protein